MIVVELLSTVTSLYWPSRLFDPLHVKILTTIIHYCSSALLSIMLFLKWDFVVLIKSNIHFERRIFSCLSHLVWHDLYTCRRTSILWLVSMKWPHLGWRQILLIKAKIEAENENYQANSSSGDSLPPKVRQVFILKHIDINYAGKCN